LAANTRSDFTPAPAPHRRGGHEIFYRFINLSINETASEKPCLVPFLNPGVIKEYKLSISYPFIAKRKLNYYLRQRLMKYFNRKSQRKSRLYRKQAFEMLVCKYGLIDPIKFQPVT
jgi:hypothetical protein